MDFQNLLKISEKVIYSISNSFTMETMIAAIALLILLALVVIFWPFIDRSDKTGFKERPIQITLGIISIVELIILTYWATLTPGQTIPVGDAVLVLGLPAIIIAGVMYLVYRRIKKLERGEIKLLYEKFGTPKVSRSIATATVLSILVAISSVLLAKIIDTSLLLNPANIPILTVLILALAITFTCLLKALIKAGGKI